MVRPAFVVCVSLLLLPVPAGAQTRPVQTSPAPVARPYKPVMLRPALPVTDPAFESFRAKLAAAIQKKERAALAQLVVGKDFFWMRDGRETANKRGTGIENLAAALGLASKDAVGWDILAGYADDPGASAVPGRPGALCAPADPAYDAKAFDAMLKATQTDTSEWSYPASDNIEVRALPQAGAPVIGKLGLYFVRVVPETTPVSAAYMRIQIPDGRTGYVTVDSLAPPGGDRLCYVKEAGAWKIGGYIGGGEP